MIKEYDPESYARKWRGSLGIAEVNGEKKAVYYSDIISYTLDDGERVTATLLDSSSELYAINHKTPQMKTVVPLYYPWEAGIYVSSVSTEVFSLLWRAHRKSYTNGIYFGSNWNLITIHPETSEYISNPRLNTLNWFTPLPKMPVREQGSGYLSKKFWYLGEKVYFLYSHIGIKQGKTFSVSQDLVPFLKPHLDEECQIKVL